MSQPDPIRLSARTAPPPPTDDPPAGRGCGRGGGGRGVGMTPWSVLVCSWRCPLADRHLLPFPLHPFPPQAVVPMGLPPHPPVSFLSFLAYRSLSTSLSLPSGGCANGGPRTFPVSLLCAGSTGTGDGRRGGGGGGGSPRRSRLLVRALRQRSGGFARSPLLPCREYHTPLLP